MPSCFPQRIVFSNNSCLTTFVTSFLVSSMTVIRSWRKRFSVASPAPWNAHCSWKERSSRTRKVETVHWRLPLRVGYPYTISPRARCPPPRRGGIELRTWPEIVVSESWCQKGCADDVRMPIKEAFDDHCRNSPVSFGYFPHLGPPLPRDYGVGSCPSLACAPCSHDLFPLVIALNAGVLRL
jgi:hypothetical protein